MKRPCRDSLKKESGTVAGSVAGAERSEAPGEPDPYPFGRSVFVEWQG
jgi:hypothetical protein